MPATGPLAEGGRMFVIHIMKTAGTSLRRMLYDALPHGTVYPSGRDLAARPARHYPSPRELADELHAGHLDGVSVVIGHYPFILRKELGRPFTVVFLRDPIARSLSMVEHRRRRPGRRLVRSRDELLWSPPFVNRHIRNYQTKMFAFDGLAECGDSVNVPLKMDRQRFRRALNRLEQVDFVGVTEQFGPCMRRLAEITGVPFRRELSENRGGYEPDVPAHVRRRLEQLNRLDLAFYERAAELSRRACARS